MAAPRYPWKLLPRLATDIEHGQRDEARRDLDAVLRIIAGSNGNNLTLRKLRCAQVVSVCLRGAHSGGAASDALLNEHLQFLKNLAGSSPWSRVEQLMRRYIARLLRRVHPAHHNHMELVVVQLRQEMRTTAGITKSLAQHATDLAVSEGHLSRSFATIAGRTFREELRRVRIEIACRLLQETSLKISAIADQVGVRDPSHFSADFQSEIGLTPARYRRMHQSQWRK